MLTQHNIEDFFPPEPIDRAHYGISIARHAKNQYQILRRQFHEELLQDNIDLEKLDKYFTRLVALTDNTIYEYSSLCNRVIDARRF